MKPLALFCTVLLLTPALAKDPATKVVDLQPVEAIALVKKEAEAAKVDPKYQPLTVLDVRTPGEYADGHLEGAKLLDFRGATFKEAIAKLDKSKPCLVYCASGGRSAKTREMMKALGFTSIYHLEGGITAWKKAGGPVTPPDAAPAKP